MTPRERFLEIAHFERTGDIFLPSNYQWFWHQTILRWVKEGAPPQILSRDHRNEFFGFDRTEIIPIVSSLQALGKEGGPPYVPPLVPLFEPRVIEEDERIRVVIDESGTKCRVYKNEPERMPQWLQFPVKTRRDWQEYKKRLDPHTPTRFPAWWEDWVRCWRNRAYPLGLKVGSFFGLLRSFIGLENLSLMYYDDPVLIHEIGEWMEYFELEIIKKVVRDVELDFVYFWEDMAYKTGSLVSPRIFREFMMPHYNKITQLLRRCGTDIILVDSDGNTTQLIPLWLEGGLSGHYPLEVAAGMDAVKLRRKYGNKLILLGNIDKRALIKGKRAIREEVTRKVPYLLSRGGYFPGVDHFVPPEVSYENYQYYLKLLREIAGIKQS